MTQLRPYNNKQSLQTYGPLPRSSPRFLSETKLVCYDTLSYNKTDILMISESVSHEAFPTSQICKLFPKGKSFRNWTF